MFFTRCVCVCMCVCLCLFLCVCLSMCLCVCLCAQKDEAPRSAQFIIHAALDMVDLKQWTTPWTHLRAVDKFNEYIISAFVTPGNVSVVGARVRWGVVFHDALLCCCARCGSWSFTTAATKTACATS